MTFQEYCNKIEFNYDEYENKIYTLQNLKDAFNTGKQEGIIESAAILLTDSEIDMFKKITRI